MIVGTAGHIDHGKTALVHALTGVDADRLPAEKARGITIDLGFAYLERGDGSVLGFVDVPGHERFMKNMLAGATGMDFLLLVVAADDGIMPQTREHLAVAQLLGLRRGAVAISKCDLATPARIEEVTAQLRDLLGHGPLADMAFFPVSARTGEGIEGLLAALDQAARADDRREDGRRLRLAVDRSFSIPGAGTVVTGTLWSGELAVGDRVTISPAGITARVRALHVQNRPAARARPGQRCGVNLGRVEAGEVQRGDFLTDPVLHAPTSRIDAELQLLASESRPLRHWSAVRLHHGAAEVAARVALLQDEPLAPGQTGRVQLVLDAPVAAAVGDRFVLRRADGRATLGGGRLLDLRPPQRRRKQPRRLAQLDAMALEDPAAALAAQCGRWPWQVERGSFFRDRALSAESEAAILASASLRTAAAGGAQFVFGAAVWQALRACVLEQTGQFHAQFPQLLGPSLQRLRGALEPPLPAAPAMALLDALVDAGDLAREAGVYRLPGHRLGLDRGDAAIWHKARPRLGGAERFRPQRVGPLAGELGLREFDLRRVLKSLARQGQVVEIAADHFFLRETLVELAAMAGDLARHCEGQAFTVAQLRDRVEAHGASVGRKVVIQLLEYLDRHGLTLRRGDLRQADARRIAAWCEELMEEAP